VLFRSVAISHGVTEPPILLREDLVSVVA